MSFRLTLTACVMFMIGLLAALLIVVQVLTLDLVTEDAATSTMDATSRSTVSSLQLQVEMLSRMSRSLAFTPAIMNSSDPGDASPTAGLIRGNLAQWPALDSIYVGYDNGYWLQVQRLDGLKGVQRERVGGPADAVYATTITQWAGGEELPTTRIFLDKDGNRIGQIEIPPRGYDARERNWYMNARKAGHLITSAPYLSFNLGVPMLTFSVPFDGKAHGVVGLDLKLDNYSRSAPIMKFGKNGYLLIFDDQGVDRASKLRCAVRTGVRGYGRSATSQHH
ncbi:cache domain-containing protein [Bradyrhizobium liaoningense]|uniref:cache domain-containing protein n=1 Tax=Bradyrhizobium liaoningense TaxID=43992 RepID=UPI001BAA9214|nr:cache domain-containing protein [Bradyrhizobium liaoningense]MBR1000447.1 cache domain-containing protein [Bradyrhizobium liaoningense]